VYYSQNIKSFVYKKDPVSAPYPLYVHNTIDEVWVWTTDIANYLKSLGFTGKVNVTGPVLFYLPEMEYAVEKKNFDIAIFDVTPFTKEREAELGVVNNYYAAKNLFVFISDIIQCCTEIEELYAIKIRMFLKHKRALAAINDMQYAKLISDLVNEKKISLVDPKENIYTLLSKTGLSITVPFSSTFVVGDSIGKPAIVYDFSENLVNNYETSGNILFVAGKKELKEQIIEIFELKNDKTLAYAK
jgi:polysaccharide biosynthesis PFTS motif protein